MENKIDIVIQGGIWHNTYTTALYYLTLPFINKVIISTWLDERDKCSAYPKDERIEYVFSHPPEHDGGGNLNYQIISSSEGLKHSTTDVVIKARSDQTILLDDMEKLNIFYNRFHEDKEIFTLGMGTHFPYHPQDHFLWGKREDLINLFDLPFETAEATHDAHTDFATNTLRGNIHLGVHYYARFSEIAKKHATDPKKYLLDAAPNRQEAFDEYDRIKSLGFKPFPRVTMQWHKYGTGYMYEGYAEQGEVYYDEEWL
tara:strand:- start:295 stop:1065 length:771 start_codon:yes stop_codon:yes gene_type:complete